MNKTGRGLKLNFAGAVLALAGLSVPATIAVEAASAPAASAWPWSPNVTLNGTISCPAWGGPFDNVQWAWVSGSTGDHGWAWLGSMAYSRQYAFKLAHVPSGSAERVTVTYGCSASGQHSTSFGVNRPLVGTTATRNIY